MDKQEAFNKVWNHFILKGGRPARGKDGTCYYCNNKGDRCAVGILIEPISNESVDSFEGTADVLMTEFPFIGEFLGQDPKFWNELQTCHDSAGKYENKKTGYNNYAGGIVFRQDMKKKMIQFANEQGLTIPESS